MSASDPKAGRTAFLTGLRSHRRLLGGSIQEYLILALALFAVVEVIMKFTLFIPGTVFTRSVGDGTSGFLIVIGDAPGWDPTLGRSMVTNFPFGDVIAKPTYVTWVAVLGPLWLISRVLPPTTALALVTVAGYVTSGLGMYALVKRLTGHWYVAAFAAYAAAFFPYHVYKSSDHLTNVFNVVVTIIVGFFLAVWRRPTKLRIAGLGAAIALACYTDGYYIMIAGFTIVGLVIAAVVSDRFIDDTSWRAIGHKCVRLGSAGLVAAILMLPIGLAYVAQRHEILSDLGQQRGAIMLDTLIYSAQPIDFVLPPDQNPLVTHIPVLTSLAEMQTQHSNISERANYLGWTVIILVFVGYGALVLARRRGRSGTSPRETAERVVLLALPLVLVWAFGPQLAIGHRVIPLPYRWLIQVTSLWRVPARMVLAIQPLAVLAAATVLDRLLARARPPKTGRGSGLAGRRAVSVAISVALTAVLAFEYWAPTTARPFSGHDMPKTYAWIRQQRDIKAILELPIGPYSTTSAYYAYAQTFHGVPTVNTTLGTPDIGLFDALVGPQNAEAINLAQRRGVDTIVVHGQTCLTYAWGRLVHEEGNTLMPDGDQGGSVCVYRLNPLSTVTDDMFPSVTRDALASWIDARSDGGIGVKVSSAQVGLTVIDSAGDPYPAGQRAILRSTIRTADQSTTTIRWMVSQGGTVVGSGHVDGTTLEVNAAIVTGSPVVLSLTGADGRPVASNQLETTGFEIDAAS